MQRREHYRVSGGKADVIVAIKWPNKQNEFVELIDTSAGGLKFQLKERSLTALKAGQELELTIKLNASSPPATMAVAIRRVVSGKSRESYACEITDNSGLVTARSEGLWKLFNRRGAFRVSAPIDKSAHAVNLKAGENTHTGILRNISSGGIAMEVPQDAEFEIGGEASCTFALSDANKTLAVTAEIRHRTPVKGKAILGLAFTPALDDREEDLVIDYVSMRQVIQIDSGDR